MGPELEETMIPVFEKEWRNVSTYAMVGLGLKLEGKSETQGIEKRSHQLFLIKLVDQPPVGSDNFAKPIVTENEHVPINRRVFLQNSGELLYF